MSTAIADSLTISQFTGLDFEMEIHNTWEEIIDFAEDLLISIFQGLRERCKYWMEVIQREYPDAGNFQIPEGRAPRIRFADGIKMLNEAGIEASADEDIRYISPQISSNSSTSPISIPSAHH